MGCGLERAFPACTPSVAGCDSERVEGAMHFAPRFDFSQLLRRARCFIHHGGQNSTMDAFAYGAPQVIVVPQQAAAVAEVPPVANEPVEE